MNHLTRFMNRWGMSVTTALAVVVLDLMTKAWGFARENDWTGFAPLLQTIHHRNYGLLFNIPAPPVFTAILSVVVLVFAVFHLRSRLSEMRIALGFGLLAGGALGNIYDRLMFGFVRDWILVGGRSAFNIADIAVVVGLLLILLASHEAVDEKCHPI